ncbi:MAG TPA: SGNH/GDSL hydrolase family protein [Chthoniobacterales bacterium]|nr:SGNH/GDSL hydrolase family protein [Chthoniobacterales bacterium]
MIFPPRSWPAFRILLFLSALIPAFEGYASQRVLFIGNSFSLGWQTPVAGYDADHVHDLNSTNYGGVPAVFKDLATEGGYDVDVSVEAVPGSTLSDHLTWDRDWLGQRKWDWVVLQDLSTRPLPTEYGGNIPQFLQDVSAIHDLIQSANPDVRTALYETWARPDLVPGRVPSLQAMQDALHRSYSLAANTIGSAEMVPVGDAFMAAIDHGLADDPTTDATEGAINLWSADRYHASAIGSYLSALMFYSTILHGNPMTLPTGESSTAANLGIPSTVASELEDLVAQTAPSVSTVPEPSSSELLAMACLLGGLVRARRFFRRS